MITTEQRELRRHSIGSSEIAALLNVDPHQSAADVYLSKRGEVADFEGNAATDRGNRLEPVLIEYAQDQLGYRFTANVMRTHESRLLHCNFDAIMPGDAPTESVEAKTSVVIEGWGEPGTDEVPDKVIAQVHAGFACVPSLQLCWVPVLLPGYRSLDFRLYRVERNETIVEAVVTTATRFMRDFVIPGVRPTDYRPSIDVLKRMKREPKSVVQVSDDVAAEFLAAREAESEAKKRKEAAQVAMLSEMGAAEGAATSFGEFSYLERSRKGYTVEPTTFRQWKFPKVEKKSESVQLERIAV